MWIQKKKVQILFNFKAYGRQGRNVTTFRILRGIVKAFLLYGCETWKATERATRVLQTFVKRRLTKISQVFWLNVISNEELWRRTRKKISGSGNKPAEMEVNQTYTDEEPFRLKQSLSWNPQGRPSRSRRKSIEQKDLDRGQSKRLRVRWPCFVAVLCSELEYKELTCITSD
jgi:ribosomal protein L31E